MTMGSHAPAWVRDAVFYQIFPDRFANGDPALDPEGVERWGRPPTRANFFGGDLAGIRSRLDHIQEVGANAIYLTPIFEADTNHRYDAADYFRIDHRLGDLDAFRRLVDAAHERGIRVVLDAVFNHSGEGHWAFRHAYAHGSASPYWNWYTIGGTSIIRDPEPNYATCMGCKYLPQLRHENPEVLQYLISVARHWAREGIDGWRLDVPFLMPMEFWRTFRDEIKSINPELYIVAEIWETAEEWLQGDTADGTMNYPLRDLIVQFADGSDSAQRTAARLDDLRARTPEWARRSMLQLLGSHDTPRIATLLSGDATAIRMAIALQLTSPGAPMIYYGDEIGLEGGDDPDCRRTMPWDMAHWDADRLAWHRDLIRLRQRTPALRSDADRIHAIGPDVVLRQRGAGDESVWVAINRGTRHERVPLSAVGHSRRHLLGDRVRIDGEDVVIGPGAVSLIAR